MSMILDLLGTDAENAVIRAALVRSNFPWDNLLPGLLAKTGRTRIPVDWADLSRYHSSHAKAEGQVHQHDGDGHTIERMVEGRKAVLGLAWYSGRITLDRQLVNNPELAGEVFLAEGAHLADFFLMTDPQRLAIYNALHPNDPPLAEGTPIHDGTTVSHGHSWFDVGSYFSWAGESFMGIFVRTYSDFADTGSFDHPVTPEAIEVTRRLLTPNLFPLSSVPPAPPADVPPVPPAVPVYVPMPFFAGTSKIVHDSHKGIVWVHRFATLSEAIEAGYRPCRTCKPKDA